MDLEAPTEELGSTSLIYVATLFMLHKAEGVIAVLLHCLCMRQI